MRDGSSGSPQKVRAEQLRQELASARCMRAHGVPNYPDPSSSSGGQVGPPAGINPQAPAIRSAARACGAGGSGISIGRLSMQRLFPSTINMQSPAYKQLDDRELDHAHVVNQLAIARR